MALELGKRVADRFIDERVGQKIDNAAWYYPEPYEKAAAIKDYVAFYKNHVTVDAE
jgi:uncharacterized protein (DUF427 family)